MATDRPPLTSDPRALLRHFGIQPKKSLGQNFLVNDAAARRIVAAADLSPDDHVLEIGPGLGALTRHLSEAATRVVAVELDPRLIPVLEFTLARCLNVQLVHGDVLALDPASLFPTPDYKVVANIPYYITSALLRHLLEAHPQPSLIVLTVQEEVARRIVARPGALSLLAVSVQFYGRPEIVTRLKPGAFYPRPQVASAVVRIEVKRHARPLQKPSEVNLFFQVVKAGFGQRRKQLHNALTRGSGFTREQVASALAQADIDPRRRAETLSVEEWVALTRAFASAS